MWICFFVVVYLPPLAGVMLVYLPTASLLFFVLPQRKVTKENGTFANRSAGKRSSAACCCGLPDRSSQAQPTLLPVAFSQGRSENYR